MRLFACVILLAAPLAAQPYDLVIANGRVMDPATNLDAPRNIGIRAGKIAAISATALQSGTIIDARGLVVSPGFIDIHQHGQTPENYRLKARDGVTTALEMEVGASPVAAWNRARQDRALINYGASAGHIPAVMAAMHDVSTSLVPTGTASQRPPTEAEHRQSLDLLRRDLDQGGLGIGMGIAYLKCTRAQILDVFRLAAERRVPVYVHMRASGPQEPGAIDSLQEVLADAAVSGASLHIVHITSTCLSETQLALEMIAGARQRRLDVTTEAYPYTAGMTDLGSAIFDPGWEHRLGDISYGDLQWAATGERLTAESFVRYRKQGGMVAIHGIPEDVVRAAIANPMVMIASDGIMDNGKGHPRAAGTYARVLGRYVREQHAVSLMVALRKMTVMPADRIGLKSKGRIAIGADADLTVFDPARVIDRATFEKPDLPSEGILYVVVAGTIVVRDGKEQETAVPGHAVASVR
jgi:N-acyl-D-aspartate/D-glutamate deacylase